MIYLGNGLYSDPGTSLQHYGVIGMKWGIRHDKEFRRDLNRHETNNRLRDARQNYKSGNISKDEYKRTVKKERAALKAKNKAMKYDYAGMRPVKGASRRSIYEANMRKAQETIPYYKAKHAVRKAVRLTTGAAIGFGAAAAGVLGAAGAVTMAAASGSEAAANGAAALAMALGYGGGLAGGSAVERAIGQKIVNNKM
jgi:hypothetical protein